MDQSTSIVVSEPKQIMRPYIPSLADIQSMEKMCQLAARSNFLSSSAPMSQMTQREADAFFVAMYGMELGVPFITSLRMIYVIDGKPACAAQLLLGLMLKHGVKVTMPNPGVVVDTATIIIQRPNGQPREYSYSKEMAAKAGLWEVKPNWKKSPREMLIWRAVSMGGRMECPDIVGGLYTLEELSPDTEVDDQGSLVGNIITIEKPPHDPNKWENGNVTDWITKWEAQGMTKPQLMEALKITERWGQWTGTVSEADAAVETYHAPKPAVIEPPVSNIIDSAAIINEPQPEVALPKSSTNNWKDGIEPPNPFDEAELRRATLARLEGEAVELCYAHKMQYVRGNGKQAGWKWVADAVILESDGSELKVEVKLFPEDVDAIKLAGYDFPMSDGPIYVPVILTIEQLMIRIKRDSIPQKQGTNPFGKPTKVAETNLSKSEAQIEFDNLPDMSDALKNQLEKA